ncbi:molybdopterin converting factor subunit 1 [Pseudanabaena sp. PCC 6802]|uniref:molybdopterin converting factor subunit 1 n=1 Tax=Pseudanabaena sp. PCC 6802 TaxID=118173 RepID=UPI00034D950D|nr:molybdopterin converting factor subunit 1 [Pseudanabaena sp. PCC 6802]
MTAQITVTVKLFAAFQEAIATDAMQITLPDRATVRQVYDYLVIDHPNLEQWRSLTRYAVNLDFVEPDMLLSNGDEVALIPPVSGG